MKSAYAGLALRQVGSHALRRNGQDVIFQRRQLRVNNIYRLIKGEFSLTENYEGNFSVTFLGPWNNRLPSIEVISPSGIKYGSKNDDGNLIAQKWTSHVNIFKIKCQKFLKYSQIY